MLLRQGPSRPSLTSVTWTGPGRGGVGGPGKEKGKGPRGKVAGYRVGRGGWTAVSLPETWKKETQDLEDLSRALVPSFLPACPLQSGRGPAA